MNTEEIREVVVKIEKKLRAAVSDATDAMSSAERGKDELELLSTKMNDALGSMEEARKDAEDAFDHAKEALSELTQLRAAGLFSAPQVDACECITLENVLSALDEIIRRKRVWHANDEPEHFKLLLAASAVLKIYAAQESEGFKVEQFFGTGLLLNPKATKGGDER